jgi:hypothetical protein
MIMGLEAERLQGGKNGGQSKGGRREQAGKKFDIFGGKEYSCPLFEKIDPG